MGVKSLPNIKALLPYLNDLGLNNIKFNGGFIGDKLYGASDVLEEIIYAAAVTGEHMLTFKLTKMNLKTEGIIKQIIRFITYQKYLIQLDLAYSQLLPK